jgi:60 kDa SS-A/Ro ribonucleoprotein
MEEILMSRFNVATEHVKRSRRPNTVNKEGADAFSKSPELEFAGRLLTSFVINSYYESGKAQIANVTDLIPKLKDPKFAAQAAIFARREFHMRSVTHVVACEMVKALNGTKHQGEAWVRKAFAKIVERPDDILEILGYWDRLKQKGIPNAMKRGLRDSFDQFDGFQLKKWANQNSEDAGYSMIDAIRVLHPKGTERNSAALTEFVRNKRVKVKTRQTGAVAKTKAAVAALGTEASETEKTAAKSAALKENWSEILSDPKKVSYFDLLKNLGGILRDAPELVDTALEILTNPEHVNRSKVLPFRFLNAYKALEVKESGNRKLKNVLAGLSDALDIACANIPKLDNTLVAIDTSGSMDDFVTASPQEMKRYELMGTSPLKRHEAAALYGAMLARVGFADMLMFGDWAKMVPYNPRDSVMSVARGITARKGEVGHGTCFPSIFETADKNGVPYERVVIFTDEQTHVRSAVQAYDRYSARNGKPWLYVINLKEYGTSAFPQNDSKVIQLSGFSDKLFDLMAGAEQDPGILVNEIRKVVLE